MYLYVFTGQSWHLQYGGDIDVRLEGLIISIYDSHTHRPCAMGRLVFNHGQYSSKGSSALISSNVVPSPPPTTNTLVVGRFAPRSQTTLFVLACGPNEVCLTSGQSQKADSLNLLFAMFVVMYFLIKQLCLYSPCMCHCLLTFTAHLNPNLHYGVQYKLMKR